MTWSVPQPHWTNILWVWLWPMLIKQTCHFNGLTKDFKFSLHLHKTGGPLVLPLACICDSLSLWTAYLQVEYLHVNNLIMSRGFPISLPTYICGLYQLSVFIWAFYGNQWIKWVLIQGLIEATTRCVVTTFQDGYVLKKKNHVWEEQLTIYQRKDTFEGESGWVMLKREFSDILEGLEYQPRGGKKRKRISWSCQWGISERLVNIYGVIWS